jgi:hypothetical protein
LSVLTAMMYTCILSANAEDAQSVGVEQQVAPVIPDTATPAADSAATGDVAIDVASEIDVAAATSTTPEVETIVPKDTALPEEATGQRHGASDGKFFDSFKVPEKPRRTCAEALAEMKRSETVTIDLSDVSDFAENGDKIIEEYYSELIKTKSFGTHSSNLYINLSNTGVHEDVVKKWAERFHKDKRVVLWNLSRNSSIGDGIVEALSAAFSDICCLNLSNTGITDAGVKKLATLVENSVGQHLMCITLSGPDVSPEAASMLRENITARYNNNPAAKCKLRDGGVTYRQVMVKRPKSGDAHHNGRDSPVAAANSTEAQAAPVAAEQTAATSENQQAAVTEPVAVDPVATAAEITERAPAVQAAATDEVHPSQSDVEAALKDAEAVLNDAAAATAQQQPATPTS